MHLDEIDTDAEILAINDEEDEEAGEKDFTEEDAPDPAFEDEEDEI